jgi:hypothetical protein
MGWISNHLLAYIMGLTIDDRGYGEVCSLDLFVADLVNQAKDDRVRSLFDEIRVVEKLSILEALENRHLELTGVLSIQKL